MQRRCGRVSVTPQRAKRERAADFGQRASQCHYCRICDRAHDQSDVAHGSVVVTHAGVAMAVPERALCRAGAARADRGHFRLRQRRP